jgi:hypothetical protein
MVDDITQKHLAKSRIRGAPATIPGSTGMVGSYDLEEVTRRETRALVLPLSKSFTIADLRDGHAKLAQTAVLQRLQVLEPTLFALHGDPMEDLPHEWTWQLLLPVRGPAKAADDGSVEVGRIHGGMYIESVTTKGFPDLRNLYTFFLGHYLPSHKQQLTRPLIYHRVIGGIESNDPQKLTLSVYIPYYLSLKAPTRLVTREEM